MAVDPSESLVWAIPAASLSALVVGVLLWRGWSVAMERRSSVGAGRRTRAEGTLQSVSDV